MAIWNLGSINIDLFYGVPHLPGPGETLACTSHSRGLGGKGANISVAAARAGARVHHIGAVGADGRWARDLLLEYGVDTRCIEVGHAATGHAVIATDDAGENCIILAPGTNQELLEDHLTQALTQANTGDWFVCQNETNLQSQGATLAKQLGLNVAYVAAPFDAKAVAGVLNELDLLILNKVEAAQLAQVTGQTPDVLGVAEVIVTLGADGADWYHEGAAHRVNPVKVTPVDSTGAGDTFAGYVIAGLDRGFSMDQALTQASRAAAIMVTRYGTADVIPDLKDLEDFKLGN